CVWRASMAALSRPSLSPMAVAHARGAGGRQARSVAGTVTFAAGYLLPWTAFGVLAYALVEGARSPDPGVLAWERSGQYVAGGVLLGAALYELSSAKRRCLRHCRDARLLRG